MKLPLVWLKDYLDVSDAPEKLAEALTLSGTKVESVEATPRGPVLDIEITTNRPDCLSILGLARELSALSGRRVRYPSVSKDPASSKSSKSAVRVRVEDPRGCPLYTARVIRGVRIGASPAEAVSRIESVGLRPVSNAVDATNYVLFETGQPLHAFDLDRLAGGVIVVRRARKGEKFLAIDGTEHELDADTLVIADAERPVAIAGVIGGKLTEVGPGTRNVLLESACFDPALVRRAARKYKIATDSSYRFERGVDAAGVAAASARARDLIVRWAGGAQEGPMISAGPLRKIPAPRPLRLSALTIRRLVGQDIPTRRAAAILGRLGIPSSATASAVTARVPSFRRDLTIEADLVEEVLRIEGFDKVREAIPVTRHRTASLEDRGAARQAGLKRFLAHAGFHEIITYSLLSRQTLEQSAVDPACARRLANPLSAELEFFRPSLLPGMLQTVLYNVHRKAETLRLFEIGNRIRDAREETALAIGWTGAAEDNWSRKHPAIFHDVKGVVENLLVLAGVPAGRVAWEPGPGCPRYDVSAAVLVDGRKIGTAGQISAAVQKRWDLPRPLYYAEIVLDGLRPDAPASAAFKVKAVPRYPLVRRDIAFIADASIRVADIEAVIRAAAPEELRQVKLFDEYTGRNIPAGRRSLAFALSYQKDTGTFTDDEIQRYQDGVCRALCEKWPVEFRA